MLNLLPQQQRLVRVSCIALALIWLAGTGGGLFLWSNPSAPLLLIGGACAAAIGLILLQQPLPALYVALFLHVVPYGLWPPAIDAVNTVVVNSSLALALGAWLLHIAVLRRPILWNHVCVLVALYIVWGIVTLLWAPDIIEGRKKLVGYIAGFTLLFLMSNQVRTLRSLDSLMCVLRLTGWTIVICGLCAMLFTDFQFGNRLKVLDVNENESGTVLILMTAGAIWPVLRSSGPRRGLHMVLSIVFILCSLMLVALSGSRGSALSLLIVLLAFWLWKPVRPWGIVGLVLIAGLLASAPFLLDTLSNRFAQQEGGELGGRDVLWEASLLMLGDVPWTGAGIGNGPFELHKYIASLTSYYNHRLNLPSHNPLLEAGVDTGLFGMLVYASICVCALWQFFGSRARSSMRDKALPGYFPLLLSITVGYLASWIKGGGMENHPTFFLLLALLLIPSQLSHEPDFDGPGETVARSPSWAAPISSQATLPGT
jgi:putative inorganic carbon (HCO3(-)) transporter